MKEIVKDLEQAIFGDDDNDESLIEGLDKDILEQEELDRFKNLISKKRHESLREYLKESKDVNPQDKCIERIFKRIKRCQSSRQSKHIKKKINNLFKKISEDNNNNNDNDNSKDNDNDDSGDNQISNCEEIVNDDPKKKNQIKSRKKILLNK